MNKGDVIGKSLDILNSQEWTIYTTEGFIYTYYFQLSGWTHIYETREDFYRETHVSI